MYEIYTSGIWLQNNGTTEVLMYAKFQPKQLSDDIKVSVDVGQEN